MQSVTHPFMIKPVLRLLLLALSFSPSFALAAVADLANAPLANGTGGTTAIKPNIALVVDDSGSMDSDYMPDGINGNRASYCFGATQYNGMAYNPALTYRPPYLPNGTVYSDGLPRFADSVFTAAKTDGYKGTATTNLSTNRPYGTGTPYYSTTTNTSTSCLSDGSYTAITTSTNIAAPNVSDGSTAALTNYANWYTYYRKRVYMMKAAAAEAFADLQGDRYRVGLFFLNGNNSGSDSQNSTNVELKVSDFSGADRSDWFTNLFNGTASGYTPTRGALSRMGRMYAGKISGWDPVQYSCQQNFSIVTSDGYWNSNNENSNYGPKQIDNTTDVGNVDASGNSAETAATAVITVGGGGSCTRVSSITVDVNGTNVELLNQQVPSSTTCETNRDTLGNKIASKISMGGFSASYSNGSNKLTIVAPLSAGDLTSTPTLIYTTTSGGRSFTPTVFSGYVPLSSGAPLPYRDALNKANTLADIAYYFYTTDLRDQTKWGNCSNTIGSTNYTNLCDNNVLGTLKDNQIQQHMTTFTVGLGMSGKIEYENNYESATTVGPVNGNNTFYDIKQGTANWPDPISNSGEERLDDLWHAAVNGRGLYFSAKNPATLTQGLKNALAAIQSRTGTSSAAATSNLEPVAGDNYVFLAQYTTVKWLGDIKTLTIDPTTGAISSSALWSAQTKLDNTVTAAGVGADGRTIKYFKSTATNKLKDFTETNLSVDGYGGFFSDLCLDASPKLSQCGVSSSFTADQKTIVNTGSNIIKYLRGQSTYEMEDTNSAANQLLRARDNVLGDIVNAAPVYVSKPPFTYGKNDATYADFVTDKTSRAASVYVAANDGMLHALNATDGTERWAFVPTAVMSKMYKLASSNYDQNHEYYVDSTPTVGDICINPTASACSTKDDWRTIIVGGFNKGGRGYYALDITDPTAPKGLWEFAETDLGYTYGNPVITRRKDGTWVVLVTSGYNNAPDGSGNTGDGRGYLYVLDATTGTVLDKIGTGTGSVTTPSNLGKINAWVDDPSLNIASVAYGVDLLGNIWRFDFDNNYGSLGKESMLLANLTVSSTPQPITTKPVLAYIKKAGVIHKMIMVGTGRYLGTSDPANLEQQSIYAIEDKLETSSGIGSARTSNFLVNRSLTQSTVDGQIIRTVSGGDIDWTSKRGWYMDLNPGNNSPGERVNVEMDLQYNMLTVAANVPDTNVCNVGGYAWLYNIDIDTGKNLSSATDSAIGYRLTTNALVAGIKVIWVDGKPKVIVTNATGNPTVEDAAQPTSQFNKPRRTMWREIFD